MLTARCTLCACRPHNSLSSTRGNCLCLACPRCSFGQACCRAERGSSVQQLTQLLNSPSYSRALP